MYRLQAVWDELFKISFDGISYLIGFGGKLIGVTLFFFLGFGSSIQGTIFGILILPVYRPLQTRGKLYETQKKKRQIKNHRLAKGAWYREGFVKHWRCQSTWCQANHQCVLTISHALLYVFYIYVSLCNVQTFKMKYLSYTCVHVAIWLSYS